MEIEDKQEINENENHENVEDINQEENQISLEELEWQRLYDEHVVDKDQLPDTCTYLESKNGDEIYIVGTAHVSEKSVEDVEKTIELVKPHTLMLELCKGRQALLAPQKQSKKEVTMKDLFENIQKQGVFPSLLSYFYGLVGKKLKITPGAEFSAAFQKAILINPKVNIMLGDRPVDVTLDRSWGFLSIKEKLKLLFMLIFSFTEINSINAEEIEKMKNKDLITEVIKELSKHFPSFLNYLLYERDMYLGKSISQCTGKRIVAVVGFGHVDGIKKLWDKVEEIDVAPLMKKSPPSKLTFKKVLLLGVSSFLVVLVGLLYLCYLLLKWIF